MDKLDEAIIMNEAFLDKLNNAIDRTVEQKKKYDFDYDLLVQALKAVLDNKTYKKCSKIKRVIPIKKEKIIAMALEFFKSMDDELYQKAFNIILQQQERTKMNIYNVHNVSNFNEKDDEFKMVKYTKNGMHCSRDGNIFVHIPLQKELKHNESQILDKNTGTLKDVCVLVHEIGHTFDTNEKDTMPDINEISSNKKWKVAASEMLLTESTAIAFEQMAINYLSKRHMFSEDAMLDYYNRMSNALLDYVNTVYYRLVLAKEKSKSGKITLDYLGNFMKENNLSVQFIRGMANSIINDNENVLYLNKYAMAALLSPTIVKTYEHNKTEGIKTIKNYLQCAKNHDFFGALKALGIEANEQGISKLAKNMKAQDAKINDQRER